jgi:hypothetical protein
MKELGLKWRGSVWEQNGYDWFAAGVADGQRGGRAECMVLGQHDLGHRVL